MFRLKYLALLTALLAIGIAQSWATNVTFQVNMTVQTALGNFVPATDSVFVRGEFQGWSGYTHRCTDGDGDGIYTGTFDLTPRPADDYEYKFVLVHNGTDTWESLANNRLVVVASDPVTIPVVYFSDLTSSESADVEVNFRVNMTVQTLTGNFNPESDWVVVRGNHANIGNWGGAIRLIEETGNPGIYSLWVQFTDQSTVAPIEYKFVILTGGDEAQADWEGVTGGGNRTVLPTGQEPDLLPPPSGNNYGEITPAIVFWGDVTADDIITQDVAVTFQVEIRPLVQRLADVGYVYDVQTGDTIYAIESIQVAGDNDPLVWDWGSIPNDFFMNDNGIGGDLTAGDGVYAVTVNFPAGTARSVMYKYGCNTLDAEAGFARNHFRDIDDSQPTQRFDIDCWGSPDTLFQDWGCLISDIDEHNTPLVGEFTLEQNFPNPFNPTTTINFTLPNSSLTSLKVFDVLGRLVGTLDMGRMEAGRHSVSFDGNNMASGVYFYRLESGAFNATRKMLLLK